MFIHPLEEGLEKLKKKMKQDEEKLLSEIENQKFPGQSKQETDKSFRKRKEKADEEEEEEEEEEEVQEPESRLRVSCFLLNTFF